MLGNPEALAALEREEALIEGSLEMRLGRREHALRLLPQPDQGVALLPEEAFLLSRIDGVASAVEVLDLSPLPRLRTLRLLVRLLRQKSNQQRVSVDATRSVRDTVRKSPRRMLASCLILPPPVALQRHF